MATSLKDTLRALSGGAIAGAAQAQTRTIVGESYEPTVWIDPDGCEHWVMDDGFEGYMSPTGRATVGLYITVPRSAALPQQISCS